jgi:hypothetical protein
MSCPLVSLLRSLPIHSAGLPIKTCEYSSCLRSPDSAFLCDPALVDASVDCPPTSPSDWIDLDRSCGILRLNEMDGVIEWTLAGCGVLLAFDLRRLRGAAGFILQRYAWFSRPRDLAGQAGRTRHIYSSLARSLAAASLLDE